jgi:AmmeMemoRadiSam system protein B
MDIRRPSVAGLFYPADPQRLHRDITRYLNDAEGLPARRPKAIISPHAGYVYSGPVAAYGYAAIRPFAAGIRRVVLLAPAHRLPFRGLAVPSAGVFRTPLGDIAIDTKAVEAALQQAGVQLLDRAFDDEHAIEVQLPFLQEVLDEFSLVPIVVGMAEDTEVAGVLRALWGGDETLVIISSDLSHYLDYETAQRHDQQTRKAIEDMRPEALGGHDACGYLPLRGLLKVALDKGLRVETLDMRNSGDTAGPRDRVVGYGSYAVYT